MVMGLDLGATTGWGAFSTSSGSYTYGDVSVDTPEAYYNILLAKKVEEKISEVNPDFVCIEGYAYGGTFFNYAQPEITGQIRRHLWESDIDYIMLPPNTARKIVVGKGNAKKGEVKKFIVKDLSMSKKESYHVYDALLQVLLGKLFVEGSLEGSWEEYVEHNIFKR